MYLSGCLAIHLSIDIYIYIYFSIYLSVYLHARQKKRYIMIHPNKREHLIEIEILMTTPPRNIGVSLASLGLGEGWFLTSLGLAISIGPIGMAYLATHLPYKINQNVGKLYHTSVLGDMKNSHLEGDLGESDYHYCWNLAILEIGRARKKAISSSNPYFSVTISDNTSSSKLTYPPQKQPASLRETND